jgi:SAM-dependent methyltransferase
VEIVSARSKGPDLALPALSRSRDLLGTREHYAVVNGRWYRADRSVRSVEPVDGPASPPFGTGGRLIDEELVTNLLTTQLWRESDRERRAESRANFFWPESVLYEPAMPGVQLSDDDFVPVDHDVLRRARRRAFVDFMLGERSRGYYVSQPAVAAVVAALVGERVGGTVLDPFCGTGSCLWAVRDRAVQYARPATYIGYDLSPVVVGAAAAIARQEPRLTTIEVANAYETELPVADVVVTAPPLALRLPTPHTLLDGSTTTDGEAAAVDLCLRSLRPRGRAVFHIGAGFTFKQNLERYRQFLATEYRVAALIGLPSGALASTAIKSVLMVVDRAEPGETFVAQFGEDWEAQLAPESTALEAALQHLDPGGSTILGEL